MSKDKKKNQTRSKNCLNGRNETIIEEEGLRCYCPAGREGKGKQAVRKPTRNYWGIWAVNEWMWYSSNQGLCEPSERRKSQKDDQVAVEREEEKKNQRNQPNLKLRLFIFGELWVSWYPVSWSSFFQSNHNHLRIIKNIEVKGSCTPRRDDIKQASDQDKWLYFWPPLRHEHTRWAWSPIIDRIKRWLTINFRSSFTIEVKNLILLVIA